MDDEYSKNSERGLTLIELLITLGSTAIVVLLIMSVFVTSYKNYNVINNNRELQFHANHILNFMADKIKISMNVEQIRDGVNSKLSDVNEQKISKICFNYDNNISKCYVFQISNNRIYYDNDNPSNKANVLLGDYIDEVSFSPVPEGVSFRNANTLKIRLKLAKGNQSYELEQIIYMGNSEI